jgi:hypothetical protein
MCSPRWHVPSSYCRRETTSDDEGIVSGEKWIIQCGESNPAGDLSTRCYSAHAGGLRRERTWTHGISGSDASMICSPGCAPALVCTLSNHDSCSRLCISSNLGAIATPIAAASMQVALTVKDPLRTKKDCQKFGGRACLSKWGEGS